MYIPIVPFVPNVKVVNKNIIYSDIVTPIKKCENSLQMTSISDIGENDLETCIKIVLETNTNVCFDSIQYSKTNKTVYFYTDTIVCTKAWTKNNYTYPKTNSHNLLEELKDIVCSKKNTNTNYVSIYYLEKLLKLKDLEFKNLEISYQKKCDKIIYSQYGHLTDFIILGFDDEQKALNVGFKFNKTNKEYEKTSFSKKDGDLYIKESNCCWNNEIIKYLGKDLSELYDECLKYSDFKMQNNYNLNSINTNLIIHIGTNNVEVFAKMQPYQNAKDHTLVSANSVIKYSFDSNSDNVLNIFNDIKDELFKKIFVEIDECPKWAQDKLYQMRQQELAEDQRKEIEKQVQHFQKTKTKKKSLFRKK